MTMLVNQELCKGCGICVDACPNGAISLSGGKAVIDQAKCTSCELCAEICPTSALQSPEMVSPAISEKPRSIEILRPQITTEMIPRQSSKSGGILSLLGMYVLPRLVDVLTVFIEQRLVSPRQERTMTANRSVVENRPGGRGRRRRGWRMSGYHTGRR